MSVPCAHCGDEIDMIVPASQAPMAHYHGRCYSALMLDPDEYEPSSDIPEPNPFSDVPTESFPEDPPEYPPEEYPEDQQAQAPQQRPPDPATNPTPSSPPPADPDEPLQSALFP